MFHWNICKIKAQQAGHRAERSCSLRPRKAVAFLTHLLRAPRSKGAGNFAVCGQRLRGHVPSKNTSPAALSWSSLMRSNSSRCALFSAHASSFCDVKQGEHNSNHPHPKTAVCRSDCPHRGAGAADSRCALSFDILSYRSRIWLLSGPLPTMTTLHSQTSSRRAMYFLQASGSSSKLLQPEMSSSKPSNSS